MATVEETVNKAISERENILKDRQLGLNSAADIYNQLAKGAAAQEGEVREWNGVKMRKVGKKWVPVSEKKTPPKSKNKSEKKVKKQEQPKGKSGMPEHMTSQHVASLKQIKKLSESGDHAAAHDIAEKLPDEVKNEIPQEVWGKMMDGKQEATKKENESKVDKKEEKPTKEGISEKRKENDSAVESDPELASANDVINQEQKKGLKRFVEKNKKAFDTGEHAHPDRSKAAKWLRAKGKGILKGIKGEVHHIKDAGKALGKLATGKKIDKHDKHALKKVGLSLGLTVGTMLATGGASIFHHGASAFMKHLGIHFIEHGLIESTGLAMIFAKAIEDEKLKSGNSELSEKEMDDILMKLIDGFIDHIENGDWSDLPTQMGVGEEDSEEK